MARALVQLEALPAGCGPAPGIPSQCADAGAASAGSISERAGGVGRAKARAERMAIAPRGPGSTTRRRRCANLGESPSFWNACERGRRVALSRRALPRALATTDLEVARTQASRGRHTLARVGGAESSRSAPCAPYGPPPCGAGGALRANKKGMRARRHFGRPAGPSTALWQPFKPELELALLLRGPGRVAFARVRSCVACVRRRGVGGEQRASCAARRRRPAANVDLCLFWSPPDVARRACARVLPAG